MRMRSTYEVLTTQILLLLTLVVLPEIPYAEAQSESNPSDVCVQFLILSTPLLLPIALFCFIKLLYIATNILNRICYACFRFQLARQRHLYIHDNSRQHHPPPPHANLSTAQERGTLDHHHHHRDANLGPILVYSEAKSPNIAAGRGGELVCPVCLSNFHDKDALRLLTKCDHAFHPHCIDIWLQNHSTCPLCRANVLADCDVAATALPVDDHTDEQQQRQDLVMETQSSSEVVLELNTRLNPCLPRSNSTGHSLMDNAGDNTVEMRIQILNPELHRSTSFDVVMSCKY
ncbi:hypothetical protein FNV43_RR21148 [Rhamnella rubrinervis]|uniref:RING-type E3 ubiquitin transferase n=1 Tax=Rhamnella rubrinervis TaxID=2594499 RepID=A0A8K0GUU7_9ROSA|nr:hypothetical protein FNV43_RR21148 [Rhamnella rubrinervis]